MEPLIYTDKHGRDVGAITDYSLDLAFGCGENDFELICAERLQPGQLIYFDNTEYGGVIDGVQIETNPGTTTYIGRTWHGILDSKVVKPPQGEAYYFLRGDVHAAMRTLLKDVSLNNVFSVPVEPLGVAIDYRAVRYDTAYSVLVKALKEVNLALVITKLNGSCTITAKPARHLSNLIDSDLVDFKIKRVDRPVNHLVCLGQGNLAKRKVIDLYADEKGVISDKQTFFGFDEVAAKYDYSNCEDDELEKEGRKKLKELQSLSGVDIDFYGKSNDLCVGDLIYARDTDTGTTVQAYIKKKIVKGVDGILNVDYKIGQGKVRVAPSQSQVNDSAAGIEDRVQDKVDDKINVVDDKISEVDKKLDDTAVDITKELDEAVEHLDTKHQELNDELNAFRDASAAERAEITREIEDRKSVV